MSGDLSWLAAAIGLGFAYAALPGAVNAESLRRGVAGGFNRAFLVHVGAMFGAGFWATVALTGASLLARYDLITVAMGLIGALFLCQLTYVAIKGALPGARVEAAPPRSGADVTVGLVVGVANPAGLPFWTGLATEVVGQDGGSLGGASAIAFVGGVLVGSLGWGIIFSALIAWSRTRINDTFYRIVNALCAVAFGYFAVRLFVSSFSLAFE